MARKESSFAVWGSSAQGQWDAIAPRSFIANDNGFMQRTIFVFSVMRRLVCFFDVDD